MKCLGSTSTREHYPFFPGSNRWSLALTRASVILQSGRCGVGGVECKGCGGVGCKGCGGVGGAHYSAHVVI